MPGLQIGSKVTDGVYAGRVTDVNNGTGAFGHNNKYTVAWETGRIGVNYSEVDLQLLDEIDHNKNFVCKICSRNSKHSTQILLTCAICGETFCMECIRLYDRGDLHSGKEESFFHFQSGVKEVFCPRCFYVLINPLEPFATEILPYKESPYPSRGGNTAFVGRLLVEREKLYTILPPNHPLYNVVCINKENKLYVPINYCEFLGTSQADKEKILAGAKGETCTDTTKNKIDTLIEYLHTAYRFVGPQLQGPLSVKRAKQIITAFAAKEKEIDFSSKLEANIKYRNSVIKPREVSDIDKKAYEISIRLEKDQGLTKRKPVKLKHATVEYTITTDFTTATLNTDWATITQPGVAVGEATFTANQTPTTFNPNQFNYETLDMDDLYFETAELED